MDLSFLTPSFWLSSGHPDALATLLGGIITALGTLLSVFIVAYLTYRYTSKHSKTTHNTDVRVDRLRRDIDALEKIWALLSYMSLKESEYAIVRWRIKTPGNKKDKEYFVHFGNLKRFILKEMNDAFYQHHAGLYMPKKIRDQLFEYKSILMGIYISYEKDKSISDDSLIKLKNPIMIEQLRFAYDKLNEDLKSELELRYQQLSIHS